MLIYDYQASVTGEVFKLMHSSPIELTTWGELAQLIGKELG
jgi:hypothetical protein